MIIHISAGVLAFLFLFLGVLADTSGVDKSTSREFSGYVFLLAGIMPLAAMLLSGIKDEQFTWASLAWVTYLVASFFVIRRTLLPLFMRKLDGSLEGEKDEAET